MRLIYKIYSSSFDELLLRDHHSNLQKLAIEIFKVKLGLPPKIMKNVFPRMKNTYDLRKKKQVKPRNVGTIWYGIETASFVAQRI